MDSRSCVNLHLQFVTIFTVSENIVRKTVENVESNRKEYVKFNKKEYVKFQLDNVYGLDHSSP